MIEYTKGKWQLDNSTGNVNADGHLIARVFGATVHNYEQNSGECYGNAKLITNAPAMFTLLEEFASSQPHNVGDVKLKVKEFLEGLGDKW